MHYLTDHHKSHCTFDWLYIDLRIACIFFTGEGYSVYRCSKIQYAIQWNFSNPASTGTQKIGWFTGVAGFMRHLLQRIVKQGLKKLAGIKGEPVFWGSGLEKFHCICIIMQYSSEGRNYLVVASYNKQEILDICCIPYPHGTKQWINIFICCLLLSATFNNFTELFIVVSSFILVTEFTDM
jgi:hypothetical protein